MPHLVAAGDIGDCIAALPILRQLGGGKLTLVPTPHPNAKQWQTGALLLMPLIRQQPYVDSVEWSYHEPAADFNIAHFRLQGCYSGARTLAESQARAAGIEEGLDLSPWLTCAENNVYGNPVVVARSKRYQNPRFPWHLVLKKYHGAVFMGLPQELSDLQRTHMVPGTRLRYHKMRDFLDAAQIIEGSKMLVANQSCFGWIAMGLGKKLIQESHPVIGDSKCPRPDNIYWTEGPLELP